MKGDNRFEDSQNAVQLNSNNLVMKIQHGIAFIRRETTAIWSSLKEKKSSTSRRDDISTRDIDKNDVARGGNDVVWWLFVETLVNRKIETFSCFR